MIPVIQTKVVVKKSNGEVVVRGNCYAAAIASILELPITEVPNVETLFHIGTLWAEVTHAFLQSKGYELYTNDKFRVFHDNQMNEDEKIAAFEYCKDKYYLVSGDSPRGVRHITIWKNGIMIHDPHPSGEGILTHESFEEIILTNPQPHNHE